MDLKEFVHSFNIEKPDWNSVPKGFPHCDLRDLTSAEIGLYNSAAGLWQLTHPVKTKSPTRAWVSPEGYKFLIVWTNSVLLRLLVRKLTSTLPLFSRGRLEESRRIHRNVGKTSFSSNSPLFSSKTPLASEHRRKAQLDDAARSVVRNIEEGYKRPTTKEYLEFLGFSQGSLEEVKGDIVELAQDGFLKSQSASTLVDLGINLKDFHDKLKEIRGFYRNLEEVYTPLARIKGEDLTVEIFLELINKTDKGFRTLVESLERGRPK